MWVAGLLGVAISLARRSAAEFKSLAIHERLREEAMYQINDGQITVFGYPDGR